MEHVMFAQVLLIEIIFDFSKNEYKNSAVYRIIEVKNANLFDFSNEKSNKYFKFVIKKIMNCDYINTNDKEKLKIEMEEYFKRKKLIIFINIIIKKCPF